MGKSYSDSVIKNALGEVAMVGFSKYPIFRRCLDDPGSAIETLTNLIKNAEAASRALPEGQDLFKFVTESAHKIAELRRGLIDTERERDAFERECTRLQKAHEEAECRAMALQAAQEDEIEYWRARAEGSIIGRIARWREGY